MAVKDMVRVTVRRTGGLKEVIVETAKKRYDGQDWTKNLQVSTKEVEMVITI